MPRIRIDGYPIGCPAAHGEGNCPLCGGGWPGTKSPSESLIKTAREFKLRPKSLGCGTLVAQGRFLVNYFFWDGKEARMAESKLWVEDDYGVGPAGGGIYGQVVANLAVGPDPEKKKIAEKEPVDEVQVGPLVILSLDGK